ncbi:Ger(x)C family spore germination protein [Bacillus timonensis]|uniref:Ger(X)C family spore germination protein n=1 Tax=Bacillus timonensis TaxID=1033734 RepID=A0A4S3PUN6_9BACI|nr:Ger(x)C family spore germination protein [Bacillus timonensis]THE13125.1 Ger(x)C family spore germination protein [Bacillus timonensis]
MKRMIIVFIQIVLSMMILVGCWSKKELNELAIIVGLGIDKTEEGFNVTIQAVNPSEIAGKNNSGRSEVVTFMQSGETVVDAMKKMSKDAPRRPYVAHLREVVFGEKLAKEGIGGVLDYLSRNHEMRSDYFITVAKGSTAYDVLNVTTALEKVPANKLFGALENSEKTYTPVKTVRLDELINSVVSKGQEPVLMGVYVYGDPKSGSNVTNAQNASPSTGLRIDSVGVFKKDKLLGWLNEEESIGFNYITDNIKSTVESIHCEDGKLTINTIRSKTKVTGKVEDGEPKINVQVFSEGNVGEAACKIELTNPKNIKELEKKYEAEITNHIKVSITNVQEKFQSDIFGFGEVIHRSDLKSWRKLQPNWDQEFENMEVTIEVNTKIRRLGTITESIQSRIGE